MMNELRTTDLLNELSNVNSDAGFQDYIKAHPDLNACDNLKDYFNLYLNIHPEIELSDLVKRSNLDRSYAYQILNGRKAHPGKYKLAALCLCAGMSLKETQRALTISGNSVLYPKFPQDAALIVCINKRCSSMVDVLNFFAENGLEFPENLFAK